MPTLDVVDLNNKVVGQVELSPEVFEAEVNEALLHESVRHYLASRRAGTHKTKVRHEVSGSGRKLWRQKGTGRARVGSIRSPLWRHGGTVHGPRPRDYAFKFNRKMALGALRSALSAKLRDEAIKVVDAFALDSPKTKAFHAVLERLEAGSKVLIVETSANRELELSSRNMPGVTLVRGGELHPYHLLDARRILFSKSAVERCSEILAASAPAGDRVEGEDAEQ